MNLELKKFDLSSIKKDKVLVFIGKRETGKSFLVRDLLYYNQDVPIGTVISGTESVGTVRRAVLVEVDTRCAVTAQGCL